MTAPAGTMATAVAALAAQQADPQVRRDIGRIADAAERQADAMELMALSQACLADDSWVTLYREHTKDDGARKRCWRAARRRCREHKGWSDQ